MKIDHVNIVCTDLERTARFYETLFGMRRGFAALLEGEWIERITGLTGARANCLFLESPGGGARLELIQYLAPVGERESQVSRPHCFGLRHLAFEVENLEALLAALRGLGIEPISEAVEVPFRVANLGRKRLLYFHDPDGALVEAAAYDPLP